MPPCCAALTRRTRAIWILGETFELLGKVRMGEPGRVFPNAAKDAAKGRRRALSRQKAGEGPSDLIKGLRTDQNGPDMVLDGPDGPGTAPRRPRDKIRF